jgi:hypothetical protein
MRIGWIKRYLPWRTVLVLIAISLLSLAPASPYIPVPIPTDDSALVQDLGDDPVVFHTRTGTRYHQPGCIHLSRSAFPIPLSQAVKRFRPCSVCHPPRI